MNDFLERRGIERLLEADLADEADRFEELGGRDLQLDEVLARAGRINRRRRTTTVLVAAAAAVALVAPAGVLLDRDGTSAPAPGPANHPTAPASPTPDPQVHRIGAFDALPRGARPATGYLAGDVWHGPDGSTWQPPATPWGVLDIAPLGDGFLVGTPSEELGQPTAMLVGADGTVVHHWPMTGGFATSAGGHVVAFAQPDGTPVVVQDGGTKWYTMPRITQGTGFRAVAVLGEDCKEQVPGGGGCTVFVNTTGRHPKAWAATSHGIVDRAGQDLTGIGDVRSDGTLAGLTSYDEQTMSTCSKVEPPHGPGWRTCANRFGMFSPDGSELLATNAIGDGLGDTVIDLLDARTGDPVARYEVASGPTTTGAITGMRWEDDSHVLAIVFSDGRWAVLRVGLDGRVEVAVPPVRAHGADPTVSPFRLPARSSIG
ncbi:MAG TPA: hypothetical protein VFM09_11070 [Marmoricola sp.]|nr:hypothetical protein [Marmoricola sp.]